MSRRRVFQILVVAVAGICVLMFSGLLWAQGNSENAFERVRQVQERHTNRLLAMNGIEGTAIGYNGNGRLAIHVFTDGPGVAGIPRMLDGVPVHIEVTGKFYALPKGGNPDKKPPREDRIDPTGRFERPVPIGVSTGNEDECSAGTIGCRVKKGDNVYALSNNHVYALENNADDESSVLQPGRYDTNCDFYGDNVIGTLADFERIKFSEAAENVVDAAIALSDEDHLGDSTPSDGYGRPKSQTVAADLGMAVQKYGRTTGLTKGVITGINADIKIRYTSGIARFVNQIVITGDKGKFSNSGDSGSLIVTANRGPVGLLFAGGVRQTIANPIDEVLEALAVEIDGE